MGIFRSIDISTTALTAEKTRIDIQLKTWQMPENKTKDYWGTPGKEANGKFLRENKLNPFSKLFR